MSSLQYTQPVWEFHFSGWVLAGISLSSHLSYLACKGCWLCCPMHPGWELWPVYPLPWRYRLDVRHPHPHGQGRCTHAGDWDAAPTDKADSRAHHLRIGRWCSVAGHGVAAPLQVRWGCQRRSAVIVHRGILSAQFLSALLRCTLNT